MNEPRAEIYGTGRVAMLGVLALLILIPVTLPVPVLRELVLVRFGVSELLTSLFMSINMIGAALAAPLAGALADRNPRRPSWIAGALLVDALCFGGLTLDIPFALFMAIRFTEGCAHIVALSLLLGLASSARPVAQRGRVMGLAGGGLLLGVALGAPLGGLLGRNDPMLPLYVGMAELLAAAAIARLVLRETTRASEDRPGLGEMLAVVRETPLVAAPLAFAFADRFTVGFYTTTFSLYLKRIHDVAPAEIGGLIATFMLPFALLSVPLGHYAQHMPRSLLLCGGSLVYGVAVASLTHWPVDQLVWLMAFTGTTAAVMFVPSMLMTTELTPERVRTASLGAFNAAGSAGFVVGPLVGGFVSQTVSGGTDWEAGYRAAFWVAGLSELLLAVSVFPMLWRWEQTQRGGARDRWEPAR